MLGGWLHIFSDVQIKQERRRETGMRGGGVEGGGNAACTLEEIRGFICVLCAAASILNEDIICGHCVRVSKQT